jgi:drug/metabolite transporter (DMT)-like permease
MAVLLALAAAAFFALGTVLQQRVAQTESDRAALRAGFLIRLARRPVWLLGLAVDALGFVAQAAALGVGRLVVVQPVLSLSLVFALPLGARLSDQRIGRREIGAALVVTLGLVLFLTVSNPGGGRDDAPVSEWLIAGGGFALVTLVLVGVARAQHAALKAALLGTATGLLFGLSAALTKATVDVLDDDGFFAIFVDWHVYALLVVGWVSMTLSEASLQTGKLAPAVATQVVFDPIASLILGLTLLQETLADDALALVGTAAGLAAMGAGLVALAVRQPELGAS